MSRRAWRWTIVALVVAAGVATALGLTLGGNAKKTSISGEIVLRDPSTFTSSGRSCQADTAHAGLKPGGTVTLYGDDQHFLTYSGLSAGTFSAGTASSPLTWARSVRRPTPTPSWSLAPTGGRKPRPSWRRSAMPSI